MSVQPHRSTSNLYLLARSILPSWLSISVGFLGACVISGAHILAITLNGKALPSSLNEYGIQAYTSAVVDPLLRITNNVTLNNGISIMLWGMFGWALYAVVSFLATNISEIKTARQEIRFSEGILVASPMHRSLIGRLLWRLFIIILFVVGTMFAAQAMHICFTNDYRILLSSTIAGMVPDIATNIGIWMGLLHGYTVLLRWYTLRTRVFSEILF